MVHHASHVKVQLLLDVATLALRHKSALTNRRSQGSSSNKSFNKNGSGGKHWGFVSR